MPRLGIIGVPGRMASRVATLAAAREDLTLVAALARPTDAVVGTVIAGVEVRAFSPADFGSADVWIEFAQPSVTASSAAACLAAKKALLVCTTGLEPQTVTQLEALAKVVPVMVAANTSIGVAVLNAALGLVARALGPTYAAEIVELHHDQKRDAPSGTALRLADTIAESRGLAREQLVTGRHGQVGPRGQDEIGVFAVRGGNVVGEHTVYFLGHDERLELSHRAQDRDLFARGALRAARWLVSQPAGWYKIEDCLGLSGVMREE